MPTKMKASLLRHTITIHIILFIFVLAECRQGSERGHCTGGVYEAVPPPYTCTYSKSYVHSSKYGLYIRRGTKVSLQLWIVIIINSTL